MRKKKLITTISLIIVIVFILLLCVWIFRLDRFGFTSYKWMDIVKYDGVIYESQNIDQNTRLAISEDSIGDKQMSMI